MLRRTQCFIDILPKLGVASVIISPSSPSSSIISCSQNALTLCAADNSSTTEHLDLSMCSNTPHIDPSSATHCKYIPKNGALHVRFRLSTQDDIQALSVDYNPSIVPDFERLSSSDLLCLLCGELIMNSSSISRVLPLPSYEWGDISSELFCHAHSHASTIRPTPSPGDLLVSEDKMEVQFSSLIGVHCAENKLYCKRCRTHIGKLEDKDVLSTDTVVEKTQLTLLTLCCFNGFTFTSTDHSIATLLTHKTQISASVDFPVTGLSSSGAHTASYDMRSLETHLAAVLWKYSCDHHCYQFTVTSDRGKPFLQISALNSTSWLLTNCHCTTTSSLFIGMLNDESDNVEGYQVLKFLFKPLPSSIKVPQYQADTLSLPLPHCLTLILLLIDSHTSLPPSLRTSVGMKLGYLRTSD